MADRNRVPPTLREVQAHLFGLITRREQADVSALVRLDDRLDGAGRVQVYANMYFLRLLDILRADYPKLAAVLGDDAFQQLAADYLEAFPSRQPSVRHLGGALPGWLEAYAAGRRRPWLADLARLEWARVQVHDRVDEELLTWTDVREHWPAHLGGLPLRLVQAHALLKAGYRVTDTWRRIEQGKGPGRPVRSGGRVLVWRQDGLVYHRTLPPDEAAVLLDVASGTTFAAMCERLGADDTAENAARRAAGLLATWTAAGLLVNSSR